MTSHEWWGTGCLPPRRRAKVGATWRSPRRSTASSVRSSHARCRRRGATWQRRPASSPRTARTCIAVCAGSGSSRRGTWRDDTTAVPRDPLRETAQPVHLAPAPPTRMFPMRALVLVVLCALGATAAAAQDTAIVIQPESAGIMVPPPELPHAVAEDAVRRYNAPTTTRLVGRARLPRGNEWRGDVAVRNGTVVVAGRVDGTLLVINGDAILDTGAVVTGDVIVVGGTV